MCCCKCRCCHEFGVEAYRCAVRFPDGCRVLTFAVRNEAVSRLCVAAQSVCLESYKPERGKNGYTFRDFEPLVH